MVTEREDQIPKGVMLLTGIFVGGLIIAAPLAVKLIDVGLGIVVTAGVLAYSITFPITDIFSEVYGRRAAHRVVRAGFATLIVVFGLIQLSIHWTPASFWESEPAFLSVMDSSLRIIVASLLAYAISQTFDVWFFAKIRAQTGGRYLWLRNNLCTVVSQALDTFIWTAAALYGVYGTAELWQIFYGEWGAKVAIAALDTPFVYLGVWWLRRGGGQRGTPELARA